MKVQLWKAGTWLAAGLALAALPNPAQAQTRRALGRADASFPEAFGFVQAVRELPDGRVLIADPLGQVLVAVNMTTGVADTIGRQGAGPREYNQPDAVYALPGDSTLLVDLGNGRLTVLDPHLQPGETMPIASMPSQSGGGGGRMRMAMQMIMPRAVDGQGRIYFQGRAARVMAAGGRPELPDSAPILRYDRGTKAIDTVGMVRLQGRTSTSSGGPNNRSMGIQPIPLSPQDGWGVGQNGRVAVARSDGYYLEWLDGRSRQRGSDVPYSPVRVRTADKEEYLARMQTSALAMSMTVDNGVQSLGFSRGSGHAPGIPELGVDDYEWPDVKPPFQGGGVRVTPEGDAWVERSTRAGAEPVFDVFGSDGVHKEQITLPAGRRVIGFGDVYVYTVTLDEYDLMWLERYRRTT
jgi:hypothetical protein